MGSLRYAQESVLQPGELASQLSNALRRSPVAIVFGGFGEAWPDLNVICGALAAVAPTEKVRLRWMQNGQQQRFGAQVMAGGLSVYVVPNDPNAAPQMLRHIALDQANLNEAPRKKKSKFRVATAIILVVALITAVASGGWLIDFRLETGRNQGVNDSVTEQFRRDLQAETPADDEGPPQRLGRFNGLYADNNDTRGWLNIPAAGVDLPVVQGRDNEHYLYHDFTGRFTRFGSIFICKDNDITPGQMCDNISVYGHNTRNGSMFGRLSRFRDAGFFRQNPTFTFTTLYEELSYVIFAVFVTNANPAQDNGNFFEYRETNLEPEQFYALIEDIRARSMINSGVDVEHGDMLLSLTTCEGDFRDARLVVFARQIRPGEEVDVSGATAVRDFRRPAAMRR